MAASKTPANAPAPKPFDPTSCQLTGRNSAKFYRHDELSPRRSRELDVYEMHLMPKLRELAVAQKIVDTDGTVHGAGGLDSIPVGLSLDESRAMFEMTDTAVLVYLKSWTLKGAQGEPLPLPSSIDDMLDWPRDIYQLLIEHAAKIMADQIVKPAPFSPDNMEDQDSPTGV